MKDWIITIAIFAAIMTGVVACQQSDWQKAQRQRQAEEERQAKKPRLYSEAGDCAVYTFKAGDRWQFFTRCKGASTSTTTTWDECSTVGKTTRCTPQSSTVESRP